MKKIIPLLFLLTSCSSGFQILNLRGAAALDIVHQGAGAPRDAAPGQPAGINGPDRAHV